MMVQPEDPLDRPMFSSFGSRDSIDMRHPYTHAPIRTSREYLDACSVDRHVGSTELLWADGSLHISTVHLVNDYSFGMAGTKGIFWETMLFGDVDAVVDGLDEFQCRYASEREAVLAHYALVRGIVAMLADKGFAVTMNDRPPPEPIADRIAAYREELELEP